MPFGNILLLQLLSFHATLLPVLYFCHYTTNKYGSHIIIAVFISHVTDSESSNWYETDYDSFQIQEQSLLSHVEKSHDSTGTGRYEEFIRKACRLQNQDIFQSCQ
jgi:hypothetical protein